MERKKWWKATVLSAITGLLGIAAPVWAAGNTIFQDTFNDVSQVDLNKTTAYVDTGQGWVELWHPSQATAISVDQSDTNIPSNIVVANASGVQWYSYDQATGKMSLNTTLGANYTNPIGVSLVPQSMTYYVLTNTGDNQFTVKQATFDGTSMVDNPLMTVTGLNDLVTISAVDTSHVAVANKAGRITVYGPGGAVDNTHSFDTGLTDIQSVVNVPGTWNFIVVTSKAAYTYLYDQSTNTYVSNTSQTITPGSQTIVSGAVADGGNLVDLITPTDNSGYLYDQSSNAMIQAGIYSIGNLSKTVAVGLPSNQAIVLADQNGTVRTYQYSGGSFVENPNLQIQGLQFSKAYRSPGVYQSKVITTGQNNMFQLVPTEQNDPGTSISYALSVDGGNTFTPVQSNTWIHLPAGTTNPPAGANVPPGPYIVQATLTSPDSNHTPRLTDIVLNAYLDVTPPTTPGQPTANPNPSGNTTNIITWTPSTDTVQAPSTGASGVLTYFIRYSTDNGNTWTDWINTNSAQPQYTFTVPPNTAATYMFQVIAEDVAGNISPASPVGSVFIDTKPLGLNGTLEVTNIIYPTPGQTFPTSILPVHVQAGGEVIYEITTIGGAQEVTVQYSDGTTQTLQPIDSTMQDICRWEGWYYPSTSSTIPLDTPQGTHITVSKITVSGLNKTPYESSSDLLVVDGSLSKGTLPQMVPRLIQ